MKKFLQQLNKCGSRNIVTMPPDKVVRYGQCHCHGGGNCGPGTRRTP